MRPATMATAAVWVFATALSASPPPVPASDVDSPVLANLFDGRTCPGESYPETDVDLRDSAVQLEPAKTLLLPREE